MESIDSIEATDEPDMTDEDDTIEAREIGLGFVIYSRFIFASIVEILQRPHFLGTHCSRAIVSENRVYHM